MPTRCLYVRVHTCILYKLYVSVWTQTCCCLLLCFVVFTQIVRLSALEAIVSHFQQLFDVPSVGGIYPTMSKIYQLVQESSTVHKQLATILTTGLNVDSLSREGEIRNGKEEMKSEWEERRA